MKILLTGSTGQLGHELRRVLAPLGTVVAHDRSQFDLRDTEALRMLVRKTAPDVIVNAAAHTAVDDSERDPETAFAVNAIVPGVLGEEAAQLDALVVHYSTDYVFDGSGEHFRDETAATGPLNVYGQSKLEGERKLIRATPRHLIFRTSWVCGMHGHNFLKTMLRLATRRDSISVIDDQIGAPTPADLIAGITVRSLATATPLAPGLYHLAAAGQTSWHGYACHVIEAARAAHWPITVACDAIHAVRSQDYPAAARRPLNSRLDTRKLCHALDMELPDWRIGVDRLLARLL